MRAGAARIRDVFSVVGGGLHDAQAVGMGGGCEWYRVPVSSTHGTGVLCTVRPVSAMAGASGDSVGTVGGGGADGPARLPAGRVSPGTPGDLLAHLPRFLTTAAHEGPLQ